MMWAAVAVGAAYLLILVRYGRHAVNGGMLAVAAIATFHAFALNSFYDEMQAGETRTFFRGALTLYEYGTLTGAGWLLFAISILIQGAWYWLGFKLAIDDEYKSRTPAGVAPGAASPGGEFRRRLYVALHKLLGEPDYQRVDQSIVAVFGSIEDGERRHSAPGVSPETTAVMMATEIWNHIFHVLPPSDREKIARGFARPDSIDLGALPRLAEDAARSIKAADDLASSRLITQNDARDFSADLLDMLKGGQSNRVAARAQQGGRNFAEGMTAAIDAYFEERVFGTLNDNFLGVLLRQIGALVVKGDATPADAQAALKTLLDLEPNVRQRISDDSRIELKSWYDAVREIDLTEAFDAYCAKKSDDFLEHLFSQAQQFTIAMVSFLQDTARDDPSLGQVNMLGDALRTQGDLAAAQRIFERTLEVSTDVLGEFNSETLGVLILLAETFRSARRFEEARKLEERHLIGLRKTLGSEHLSTLTCMVNLAETTREAGDFPASQAIAEEAHDIANRVYGPEHKTTLLAMTTLGYARFCQGDIAGALSAQERVLETHARVLGENHPDTVTSRNILAGYAKAGGS